MQKRTYLVIPKENKTEALRAAGRLSNGDYALEYDRSQKVWFAKAEADLEKVKLWLPENTTPSLNQTSTDNLSPAEEFAQVLQDAGFIFPAGDLPEMDGKKHRVFVEGQKHTSAKKNARGDYPGGSGVYQGFLDGRAAGWYQNHRASEGKVNWTSTGSYTYDPAEVLKQRALAAQKRWDREMKSQEGYARIAKTLSNQWSKMPNAPDSHAYLARKGVPAAAGVKLDKYDNLVIPLSNTNGELRSLQYIKPDGTKNLKKDAEKTGNFFVVGGELNPHLPFLYAEGYATAKTLNQATGIPVIMTVDAGNMVTVSRKINELYPDSAHIILGEDDFTNDDNKGLNKAREAADAIGGTYIIPQFTESERTQAFAGTGSFSDFNDIHTSRGIDAVREQLAPVLDPLLPHWRKNLSEENIMPSNFEENRPQTIVSEPSIAIEPNKVEPSNTEHKTITLYHGSPATFSAIDSEKIGLGQNFVGRGFYTDTSPLGVQYVMEEINHQNFHIYELEIPSNSIILDRWDDSSLTDELRERIREAGKTVHQQFIENGNPSRSDLGERLASCEKVNETFISLASSPQGMSILKEAGIGALKDNSYVAIVNTDLIDNIRLHSAGGNKKDEMTKYIENALTNVAQDSSRLSNILQEEPNFSIHYDAIHSELVKLATAQNKPEEAERLTSILTHTLVETIDSNPVRKNNITPLNRLYAETIRSLDLNYSNSVATLGNLIDSAVVNISPNQKLVPEPDKPQPVITEPEPTPEPDKPQLVANEPKPNQEPDKPEPLTTEPKPNQEPVKPEPLTTESKPNQEPDKPEPLITESKPNQEPDKPEPLTTESKPNQEPDKPEPALEQNTQEATPVLEIPEQPLPDSTPISTPKTADIEPSDSPENAPPAVENGFNFTFGRMPGDVSEQESSVTPIDLDKLLQGLTSRQEGRTWIYSLDGQDAFRDYGDRIVMATPEASENDRMILAALLSAKANQRGAVEITGSDEFIQRTMGLIADHNIDVHFKNPQQREQFEALLKARAENAVPKNGMNIGPESTPEASVPVSPAPASGVAEPALPDATSRPKEAQNQPVTPELSVLDKETLRTGLTGKLLDAGTAPYKFDKSNSESFYVQMRTKSGNKTYWGVELEQALKDSGNQPGDMVKLQYLGKKAVTINVPVKDAEGNIQGFERLDTHRNHWTVTPALDNQLLVADKHAVAPAELAAYDGNAFWKLQQQIIQNNNLPLSSPAPSGHGLLYTSPDGKGQVAPEVPPVNAPVPNHSKAAGSVVMAALDDKGELLAHLVKGHGDYLQGVIRHEGELKNVLARICTTEKGNTYLALNSVQDNGLLQLIGHASAVNTLKNAEVNHDTFAFQMKGKDAHKFAVPLISPEKIPPALHSKLGFSQAYAPPKSEEPVPTSHVQAKPAIQPQPM
ncbi:LPD7 domain-containing protein [Pectobacterium carotovorum]|uniref:LPD7 domain-containing protein n=1 Tax=Pectobacterium carotovorum TaxID=554 RepID=UPI0029D889D7|nr:LPD7 domain-containing protein [Pectobacterium carotovorum]MDX6917816.1 LPD7 domain-containing protein [Pectobacterium carotovorum]